MRGCALCVMVLSGVLAAQDQPAGLLLLEQTIKTEKTGIRAAEVDPTGRTVLAGAFDGCIQLWDTTDRKLILRKRGDLGGFG